MRNHGWNVLDARHGHCWHPTADPAAQCLTPTRTSRTGGEDFEKAISKRLRAGEQTVRVRYLSKVVHLAIHLAIRMSVIPVFAALAHKRDFYAGVC